MFDIKEKGIRWALVAAVISGVSVFLNKYAVSAVTPPVFFATFKNLSVAIILLFVVLATKKTHKLKSLSRKQLTYLVGIGVVGGSLPFYLFFSGLSQVSAVNAAIIHKTLFIWVALLAIPFLKEKLNRKQVIGVAFVMAGNLLIGGFVGFSYSTGELMMLAATILWAIENVVAKKVLVNTDSDIVSLFRMGVGSIILCLASFASYYKMERGSVSINRDQIFLILVTIVMLAAYVTSWYRALKHSPAITVTIVLTISTLITNVLSAVLINHSWNIMLTTQTAFLVLGTIIFMNGQNARGVKTQLESL